MPTTANVRKLLDLKAWEMLGSLPFASAIAGVITIPSHISTPDQATVIIGGANGTYIYYPKEDHYGLMLTAGFAATAAGACGCWNPNGPTGTTTAGTTTSITTNFTTVRSLVGHRIRLTGGTGGGQEGIITAHAIGANTVFTVASWTNGIAPDATTTWTLRTGRYYVLNGGTLASGFFRYYDWATSAWTTLSVTGLPATWGTDGSMVSTHNLNDAGAAVPLSTSRPPTATAATTLTDSVANWAVNQWTNYQVRIISGTGGGQVRTISSNTATQLTVSAAWSVTPDTGSRYVIETNENFIYLFGNNAVTLYKYDIAATTWSTISPVAVRTAVAGTPCNAFFVADQTAPDWNIENAIINGKYIYAFAGGVTNRVDRFNIPGGTWENSLVFGPGTDTFTTGSHGCYIGGYIYMTKDGANRWFRLSPSGFTFEPWSVNPYPGGTNPVGNRAFCAQYTDGSTVIRYVYHWLNNTQILMRAMAIEGN